MLSLNRHEFALEAHTIPWFFLAGVCCNFINISFKMTSKILTQRARRFAQRSQSAIDII